VPVAAPLGCRPNPPSWSDFDAACLGSGAPLRDGGLTAWDLARLPKTKDAVQIICTSVRPARAAQPTHLLQPSNEDITLETLIKPKLLITAGQLRRFSI
jgi:hypothetical protein